MQPSAQPLTSATLLQQRYQIHNLLGQGGMSRVYLATDLRLNIRVAVKENLQSDPQARDQFRREAQILARLSHRNLPRVTDHFDDAVTGRQYLVMDYVEGEDLAAMVERGGPLPEAKAVGWISQVLAAVEYLHSQQPPVIHRDIKPSNIKITPQGNAMLVDFGIAKTFEASGMTMTGARAATPGYAPPEQYGMRTDQRSDIYAVGATLYSLVTGKEPPESTLRVANLTALRPPRQLAPTLSPQVEHAILVAMELDTSRRWQRAELFQAALRAPLPAAPRVAPPSPAQPTARTAWAGADLERTQVAPSPYSKEMAPVVSAPPMRAAAPPVPVAAPPKPKPWGWAVASALVVIVVISAIVLAASGTLSKWFSPNTYIVVVPTSTPIPTATTDFNGTSTAVADNFNATFAAQAGNFQGTQTAQAPTPTLPPTAIPPTLAPLPATATRPLPTRPPAAPTAVPPPAATATPVGPATVAVVKIRMDPADPHRNQDFTFYVTFRNTFTTVQQITWSVWVYLADQPRNAFWRMEPAITTNLAVGDMEVASFPQWPMHGPGEAQNFIVYVKYIAPDGANSPVPDLNGNPAQMGFTVNP